MRRLVEAEEEGAQLAPEVHVLDDVQVVAPAPRYEYAPGALDEQKRVGQRTDMEGEEVPDGEERVPGIRLAELERVPVARDASGSEDYGEKRG